MKASPLGHYARRGRSFHLLQCPEQKELFDDLAKQYVLWNIDCQLEWELAFPADYADAIAQARETVKKNY